MDADDTGRGSLSPPLTSADVNDPPTTTQKSPEPKAATADEKNAGEPVTQVQKEYDSSPQTSRRGSTSGSKTEGGDDRSPDNLQSSQDIDNNSDKKTPEITGGRVSSAHSNRSAKVAESRANDLVEDEKEKEEVSAATDEGKDVVEKVEPVEEHLSNVPEAKEETKIEADTNTKEEERIEKRTEGGNEIPPQISANLDEAPPNKDIESLKLEDKVEDEAYPKQSPKNDAPEKGEESPRSVKVTTSSRPQSKAAVVAKDRKTTEGESEDMQTTADVEKHDSKHSSRIGTPQLSSSRVDGKDEADVRPLSNLSKHSRLSSRPQSKVQDRPASRQNGFVEHESIETLDKVATPGPRSRPTSGYRKSGTQTPHLPEVRQTTPLNLVTANESGGYMNGHTESEEHNDRSSHKGMKSRQSSGRAHVIAHNSSNEVNDLSASLVFDKSSRPGSRTSSQLEMFDNSRALVPATASPHSSNKQINPYSNTTVSTYAGQLSVTPRAGVSSITPRATSLNTACVVCDKTLRDPRILPCLHSLCFGCLDALMESNKTKEEFACPSCDDKISILNPEFMNNVYLLGVLGAEAAKSGEAGQCAVCSLKNIPKQAEYQCLDCVDLLCENCGFAHSATRATINHLVVSLKDLATGEYDAEIRQRSKVKCRNHPDQPFDNYCQVCDMLICRECRLLDHMGHKYVPIDEAHKKTERKLMDLIQKTITKQHALSAKHKRLSRTMAEIDSMEDNLTKYVEKVTREIIEQIQRQKDETLVKLKTHMDKQRLECVEQKNESDAELKKLTTGIVVCEEIVQNGRHDEMLYLAPVLQKRLLHLSQTDLPTKEETQVDFPAISLHSDFKNIEDVRVFYMAPEDEHAPSKLALLPGKPSMSLKLLERINILGPRDYMAPKVTGLACTMDGNIVIGDSGNANVKLFSSKGHYLDTLLSCKPVAMAACSNIVAVSDRFSVLLISTDKKFRRRIPLESNGSIFAVTSYQGRYFAVLVPIAHLFKVFDTKGDFVQEFPMVRPRRRGMQRNPMFLTANNQGELIFSDWGSNSIVHINNSGEVLHEYRCGNIGRYNNGWMPGGMAVDNYDNILIADQQNGEVFILNKDLRIIFKRKTKKDGMDKPLLIAGDNQGHYYVSGKGGSVNVYLTKYS